MKEPVKLVTEIVINKPASVVREHFLDFKSYPDWNPFILSMEVLKGDINNIATVKTQLKTRIQPPGGKAMIFTPFVLVNNEQEFKWIGKVGGEWLIAGTHYFYFEKVDDNSCKFVQGEFFTGMLAGLFLKVVGQDNTRKGFEEMNLALKKRCEST
jgi:hypothetical protein